MTETLFITGGAGFIGSNFVRHVMAETNLHLVVIDKLTYAGSLISLETVRAMPRVTFIQADIADVAAMAQLFEKYQPTFVVNLAAETHVDRSIDGPRTFINTNINGTFELLDAARLMLDANPGRRDRFRLLHVSTDEVYGSLGPTGRFTEDSPYLPNSPYAASKAAADHLVRAYFETYRLPTLITNCSNNYGPYQYPEKLIPLMILNALEGKQLPIYGDGGNVRDWLYVEDHCAGILSVLLHGKPGNKYNIGGDNECTNLSIVDTLCTILEEAAPAADNPALRLKNVTSYSQLKTFVADRPGHDKRYAIDASKIRSELGWSCSTAFADGLRLTVGWYLDNRRWCDAVQTNRYGRERLGLGAVRLTP